MTSCVLDKVSSNAQPVVRESGIAAGQCPQLAVCVAPPPSGDAAASQSASEPAPQPQPADVNNTPPPVANPRHLRVDPESMPALAQEIVDVHLRREQSASRNLDYLSTHVDVTATMRTMLIDWFVGVGLHFDLRATYFLAVDVLDRYLTVTPNIARSQLLLVGVTAMLIAAKHDEVLPLSADDCVRVANSTFGKSEVVAMERTILAALEYRLTVTTPYPLLAHLLEVSQAPTPVRHAAMYFLEHAVLDYGHLRFLPSQLASASLYLANLLLQREPWPSNLHSYSRAQQVGDFIACARNLLAFVTATIGSPHQAIRRKYSRAAYSGVAQLPLPDSQLMVPAMPSLPPAAPHCPEAAAPSAVDVASGVGAGSVPALAQDAVGHLHLCREQSASRDPNYLSAHVDVNARMRMILIDWFVDVANQFRLHAATYFSAVDVLDRYLTVSPNVSRSQLQLVGVTAVLVAAKHEEQSEAVRAPSADDCARITANTFTADEVLAMERTILAALGAVVTVPTPYLLLAHSLDVSQAPTAVRQAAMYFLEHAVLDYGHLRFLSSQLANASLYLANLLLRRDAWPSVLQSYKRAQRVDDFIECARNLLAFVTATVDSPYQAIRRKYSRDTYGEVARLPLPDVAALQ
jgi:cyclin A